MSACTIAPEEIGVAAVDHWTRYGGLQGLAAIARREGAAQQPSLLQFIFAMLCIGGLSTQPQELFEQLLDAQLCLHSQIVGSWRGSYAQKCLGRSAVPALIDCCFGGPFSWCVHIFASLQSFHSFCIFIIQTPCGCTASPAQPGCSRVNRYNH